MKKYTDFALNNPLFNDDLQSLSLTLNFSNIYNNDSF